MTLITAQDIIKTTLTQDNVILCKQLAYLANTPIYEARIAFAEYLNKNDSPQNFPIYLVSGTRLVHGQLSYSYLVSRPSTLEQTKAKFANLVAVQLYGIVQAPVEPTAPCLQDLLLVSQRAIVDLEFTQLSLQPVLQANPLRTNSLSNVSNNIKREANAYAVAIKPIKHDMVQGFFTAVVSPGPDTAPAPKNASIVQKANKLNFGPAAAATAVAISKAALFDDDNDFGSSKPIPKRSASTLFDDFDSPTAVQSAQPTQPSKTSSLKKLTSATSAASVTQTSAPKSKPTHNLFDEYGGDGGDGDDNNDNGGDSTARTKPTHNLFDEWENDDNFTHSAKSSKTIKSSNAPKGSNSKPSKAKVVVDSDNSDDGGNGDDFSIMSNLENDNSFMNNNNSDSDNDMVKASKGVSTKKTDTNMGNNIQEASKRVIIDSSDDEDSYSKTTLLKSKGNKTGCNTSQQSNSGFLRLTEEEYQEILQAEEDDMESKQKEKEIEKTANRVAKLTCSTKQLTRINQETGKKQRLVRRFKIVNRIDEDGFDVTEKVEVEEWIDDEHVGSKSAAVTTTTPSPAATTQVKKSAPVMKQPPKNGGILAMFGKK
jgi:hypothetical protein